jgi:hypothetical protein
MEPASRIKVLATAPMYFNHCQITQIVFHINKERNIKTGRYIQDKHGADINKHWPGSDIILASYWKMSWEVHLSAIHAIVNVTQNQI